MNKTGILWDERFLSHDTGHGHPERAGRLIAIREVLDAGSKLQKFEAREATAEEVSLVHSPQHVQAVHKLKGLSGYFDGDTPYSPQSAAAAFLAVGGTIQMVDRVHQGELSNAFCFPRPPGHHAESHKAMGFCVFNNVAVAAEHLIKNKKYSRVAIVDFDVHHGNGTQHIFYDRSDVLYVSTHRFPFYPGTGADKETGNADGKGYTLNIPLLANADDSDYQKSFEEEIVPAISLYNPDFILVSAGFDAHARDPLGGMNVSQKGFGMMAKHLNTLAQKYSGGKIVYVLEGGYDLKGLQEGVEAVLAEMIE